MSYPDKKIAPGISRIFKYLQIVALAFLILAVLTALLKTEYSRIFAVVGIAAVIIIPITGIIAAMIGYIRLKDYRMAFVAFFILSVIFMAVIISK